MFDIVTVFYLVFPRFPVVSSSRFAAFSRGAGFPTWFCRIAFSVVQIMWGAGFFTWPRRITFSVVQIAWGAGFLAWPCRIAFSVVRIAWGACFFTWPCGIAFPVVQIAWGARRAAKLLRAVNYTLGSKGLRWFSDFLCAGNYTLELHFRV